MSRKRLVNLLNPGFTKRHVFAWAIYDFANSGYTTVVITAVFNAYFVSVVSGGAIWGTFLWPCILSLSYVLVIVTGPIIGAYIDISGRRKRVLIITTIGCIVSTATLSLVGEGDLWKGSICLILSNYFFGIGENIISSYLPDIAKKEAVGRISGFGWAVGYLGGIVTLLVSLIIVLQAQVNGLGAEQYVPMTILITAVVFAFASIPTFVFLTEGAPRGNQKTTFGESFIRFFQTLRQSRKFKDLYRFLISTIFFQGGVQAVIALAAIYAQQVIGFNFTETIILILVVNITAAIGAWLLGRVHDSLGHKKSLTLILIGWILVIVMAWFSIERSIFWVTANFVGLLLGACQSNARAFVSALTPESRRAEFFGLWGLAVKSASILGPVTFGALTWVLDGDHRNSILSLVVMFVIGLLFLLTVNVQRGVRAAELEY